MTREDLLTILLGLPANTPIFVRHGSAMDDAFPAQIRVFSEDGEGRRPVIVAYVDIDRTKLDEHRNYPEGYPRSKEVKLDTSEAVRRGEPKALLAHAEQRSFQLVSAILNLWWYQAPPAKIILKARALATIAAREARNAPLNVREIETSEANLASMVQALITQSLTVGHGNVRQRRQALRALSFRALGLAALEGRKR